MTPFPLAAACVAALYLSAAPAVHAALPSAEIEKLCAGADGSHECGRRIETAVTAKLPDGLAKRNGDTLTIALLPEAGATGSVPRSLTFTDKEDAARGIAYTVWDYLPMLDAVVLYVNEDLSSHFFWIGRSSGKTVSLPAEPVVAPDGKRLATADFCASGCTNEIVVWKIGNDLPAKDRSWAPKESWIDAEASWSLTGALNLSYQKKGAAGFSQMTRRMNDSDWRRATP